MTVDGKIASKKKTVLVNRPQEHGKGFGNEKIVPLREREPKTLGTQETAASNEPAAGRRQEPPLIAS